MALINNFPYDGIVTINRVVLKKQFTIDDLQERVADVHRAAPVVIAQHVVAEQP